MFQRLLCCLVCVFTIGKSDVTAQIKPQSHQYVEVNGIKLHYVVAGSGKTILFLHGFPEFWYAWSKQLDFFGPHYRAVALEMRGYNLSDKPKALEEYAIPKLVADIKGVLEKVSPGKPAILI